MIVYYDNKRVYAEGRMHPYTAASSDHAGYIDFRAQPERIETSLEDFLPHAKQAAVQTFYSFLRWVNGSESHLETNDCALRPPNAHRDLNSSLPLCIHGRVYILFRRLDLNCLPDHVDSLCLTLAGQLEATDLDLTASEGVVGFTKNQALYMGLSNGFSQPDGRFNVAENDPGIGQQLMLSFWAYGNDEQESFGNLDRVFRNIWHACREVSKQIEEGLKAQGQ